MRRTSFSTSGKVMAGVVIVIGAVLMIGQSLRRDASSHAVERAMRLSLTDPVAAERLYRQIAASSGKDRADAEVGLARIFARRGDWPAVERIVATVDPQECRSELLLLLARDAVRANRPQMAIDLLESVPSRGGREAISALEVVESCYGILGKHDERIAVVSEMVRRDPGNSYRTQQLLQLLKSDHREVECLEAAREALRHSRTKAEQREIEYVILEQEIVLGEIEAARQQFDRLKNEEGESPRLEAKQVDLLRLEGRLEEALSAATRLLPKLGPNSVGYLARGSIYLDLRRYAEAARDFEKVVARERFNEGAHFKLSEAYRAMGELEKARQQRVLGTDIREKRHRINALQKELENGHSDRAVFEELSSLNRDVGASELATYWQQRADSADSSREPTERSRE